MNLLNFGIMVGVAVPIVLLGLDVLQAPTPALDTPKMSALVSGTIPLSHASQLFSLQWWQALSYHRPLWFVNLVFFIFVDVMFWVIALLQGTTWVSVTRVTSHYHHTFFFQSNEVCMAAGRMSACLPACQHHTWISFTHSKPCQHRVQPCCCSRADGSLSKDVTAGSCC
jgi:Ni/Fe-hydrogenase subunit HybB-like protein